MSIRRFTVGEELDNIDLFKCFLFLRFSLRAIVASQEQDNVFPWFSLVWTKFLPLSYLFILFSPLYFGINSKRGRNGWRPMNIWTRRQQKMQEHRKICERIGNRKHGPVIIAIKVLAEGEVSTSCLSLIWIRTNGSFGCMGSVRCIIAECGIVEPSFNIYI